MILDATAARWRGLVLNAGGRHQTSRMSDSLLGDLINGASLVRLGPGSKWFT